VLVPTWSYKLYVYDHFVGTALAINTSKHYDEVTMKHPLVAVVALCMTASFSLAQVSKPAAGLEKKAQTETVKPEAIKQATKETMPAVEEKMQKSETTKGVRTPGEKRMERPAVKAIEGSASMNHHMKHQVKETRKKVEEGKGAVEEANKKAEKVVNPKAEKPVK